MTGKSRESPTIGSESSRSERTLVRCASDTSGSTTKSPLGGDKDYIMRRPMEYEEHPAGDVGHDGIHTRGSIEGLEVDARKQDS